MELKAGITLQGGKYLLNQALGNQDFGITYLATQTYLNQTVVVKTIDPSLQITRSFPHLHQRFVEETRLLARSQHPSIVRVLDFFQEENLPFIVMDQVPGRTLAEIIQVKGALTEAQAVYFIRQIGAALAVAHHNGLIHRNLKPQTVIRRQGTNLAVLVGFGIAHDLATSVTPSQNSAADLNSFAPPDASWLGDNRFAIDLYALVALFYYLLTARPPSQPLQFDGQLWNPAIKQAILRGLSNDKNVRPQTIADWLRLLPRESLPLVAPPTAAAPPPPPVFSNGHSANAAVPIAQVAISPVPPKPSTDNGKGAALPIVPAAITQPPSTVNATAVSAAKKLAPVPAVLPPRLPKILGLTSVAAAAIGVCFGLVLRFSAAQAPGASLFHPEQSFPSKDWKGTPNAEDLSEIPVEKPVTGASTRNAVNARPSETSIPSGSDYKNAPPADTYLEPAPPKPVEPRPATPRAKDPVEVAPPIVKPDPVPAPPAPVAPAPNQAPEPPAPEPPSAAPEPPPVNKQPIGGSTRDTAPVPPKE
ncbi:serine/threonine protein kinase [Phormidesmis sp. 146-35]